MNNHRRRRHRLVLALLFTLRLAVAFQPPRAVSRHGRRTTLLPMGGYYVEADEEAAKNIIDRSQTHMIFGLRCLEAKIISSVENDEQQVVVGLVPLLPSNNPQQEPSSMLLSMDGRNSQIVSRLLEAVFGGDDAPPRTLVEVGADPLFSLLAARWMGSTSSTTNDDNDDSSSILVVDVDEQRLRVLEHAHLFFNNKPPSVSVRTSAAEPIDCPASSVVVVTTDLSNDRLEELVRRQRNGDVRRLIVPSTLLAAAAGTASYDSKSLGVGDEHLEFWEILPPQ